MKKVMLSLFILAIAGCNTGQYQSFNRGIGYLSEPAEDNSYYVTYTGSAKSKIEKINDFALLRCAELTIEKGYDYFVIIKAENNKTELRRIGSSNIGLNSLDLVVSGSTESPNAKSELTILLFNEKPEGIVYDANTIALAIKSEYGFLE